MISIKEESYKELIRKSISSFDNAKNAVKAFCDFLAANGLMKEIIAKVPNGLLDRKTNNPIELNEICYEFLTKLIEEFLKFLTREEIENAEMNAEYIISYLYVVYYRAIGREFCNSSESNHIYGMSYEKAYGYLTAYGADGLMYYFRKFCLSKSLPAFLDDDKGNLFFFLLSDIENGKKIIASTGDEELAKIYSSFRHSGGLMDYRLFAYIYLKFIEEAEAMAGTLSTKAQKAVKRLKSWKQQMEDIWKSPEKVDFHEYGKTPSAAMAVIDLIGIQLTDFIDKLSLRGRSLAIDLMYFGNLHALNKILNDYTMEMLNESVGQHKSDPIRTIDDFEELLNRQLILRNEERYEKIRSDLNKIDAGDVEDLVKRFFALSEKDRSGTPKTPYPSYASYRSASPNYDDLYKKLSKNKEAAEILAIAQRDFENTRSSGLTYNDFSRFTFIPIKIIERMLKTEIYNKHPTQMQSLINQASNPGPKGKQNKYELFKNVEINKPDIQKKEMYPHNPYEMELGKTEAALRLILGSRAPWFMLNKGQNKKRSIFYEEFIDKTRNGYFHTNTISDIFEGQENYRKVAYWFVEVLDAFDPF